MKHQSPQVHLGGTAYTVKKLSSPSGTGVPSGSGSYTGAPGDTFNTWNLAQGTDNWNSPGSVEAYSGCDATKTQAFTPIVQICIKSGIYIDHLSFMFANGDTHSYGGGGGGNDNVRILIHNLLEWD